MQKSSGVSVTARNVWKLIQALQSSSKIQMTTKRLLTSTKDVQMCLQNLSTSREKPKHSRDSVSVKRKLEIFLKLWITWRKLSTRLLRDLFTSCKRKSRRTQFAFIKLLLLNIKRKRSSSKLSNSLSDAWMCQNEQTILIRKLNAINKSV